MAIDFKELKQEAVVDLNEPFDVRPPDFSDAGNANRFSVWYRGLLAYTDALGWLWWNGRKWEESDHKAAEKAVKLTEEMLLDALGDLNAALHAEAEAKALVASKEEGAAEILRKAKEAVSTAKSYHAHALRSRGAARIGGILELAKHDLVIRADKLDADPFLLNTPGGVVDLKTGELKPHGIDSPFLWCTKMTAVSPGGQGAEMWVQFLDTITCGDRSLAGFLQLVAGMAAIGKVFHEGLIIANGSGRNGKSTFFNVLGAVLGDYSGHIDIETLTTDRQNRGPELATLRGKRLVIAGELEEGKRLSVATVKRIASTDVIRAEQKYRAPEDFIPSHTLVLFTNHLPRVGSTDNGTWRRLTIVPFNAVIPQGEGIQNYADVLVEQAGPVILTWIIQGAMNFIRNNFKLVIPDVVAQETEEYRARENWLENFIEERCIRDPNARVGARDLYLEYKDWANSIGDYVRRENDFSAAMAEAGFKRITPKNKRTWVGLRLNLSEKYGNHYAASG